MSNILGSMSSVASNVNGEEVYSMYSPDADNIVSIFSPIKTLFGGIGRVFTGFKNVTKNKRGLITAIILAISWIVLTVLPMLGINALPVKIISGVTFAQGGYRGGVAGAIGGVCGKGMVATCIVSLVSGGFKKTGNGFIKIFTSVKGENIGIMLIGMSISLIVLNFMQGEASPIQSMAGITGFLVSMKALSGKGNSFLRKLSISLTSKKSNKMRVPDNIRNSGLLSGITIGFALGTGVSFIPWGYVSYCLGAGTLIAGIICLIVKSTKKAVIVQ